MQTLLPPPDVKAALAKFGSWGAVVEHALFAAPSLPNESAHERAARSGLENIIEATRREVPLWTALQADTSKVTRDHARRQSVRQFFGPGYSVSADSVILRGRTSNFLNDYFREGTEETKANVVPPNVYEQDWPLASDAVTLGYARALFEPPHGLSRRGTSSSRLTNLEIAAAFHRLRAALFGNPDTLEIYAWPTDVSNYFDAGHEWWGSFFWTVYAPDKNWIVTILASTTD